MEERGEIKKVRVRREERREICGKWEKQKRGEENTRGKDMWLEDKNNERK